MNTMPFADADPVLQLQHQALIDDIIGEARQQRLADEAELRDAEQQLIMCVSNGRPPTGHVARLLLERMFARLNGEPSAQIPPSLAVNPDDMALFGDMAPGNGSPFECARGMHIFVLIIS